MKLFALSVVAATLAAPALALADSKADVTALVTKNVTAVGDDDGALWQSTVTDEAVRVLPFGTSMDFRSNFYGLLVTKVSSSFDKLTVVVDDVHHVAWFHTGVTAATTSSQGKDTVQWRVSGVAVAAGNKAWKLAAIMWSRVISDKELMKEPQDDSPGDPGIDDDKAIAKPVAGWIASGLAAHAATGAVASGTAPSELATGKQVATLVTGWDKLKMSAERMGAVKLGGDAIAFASGIVDMPTTKGKHVAMDIGIVLVPDGSGWKWVSLDFASHSLD